MCVLITTMPGDAHAHAVRWALERMGHKCYRWLPSEVERVPVSGRISDDTPAGVLLWGPDGAVDTGTVRTVWFRRFPQPRMPDQMLRGDQTIAQREVDAFLSSANNMSGENAFWANSPAAQRVASQKASQLMAARRVGLSIPRTLLSNDMEAVRVFVRTSPGRVIYKGFRPAVWVSGDRRFHLQTAVIDESHLTKSASLRLSPGIFQEFVPKLFELRVTIFGRTCIAAKITGQHEVDWRRTHRMDLEQFELPPRIESRLLALMDELGLRMGTVDMIVTPSGDYVFLEINEQGQFLWVEQMNPEIALLEPFARFLAAATPDFTWPRDRRPTIRFGDYMASAACSEFEEGELKHAAETAANPFVVSDAAAPVRGYEERLQNLDADSRPAGETLV